MPSTGEQLVERKLEREGDGYAPGQGSVTVAKSGFIKRCLTGRVTFVNHNGEAQVIYAIKARQINVYDLNGEMVPKRWTVVLCATASPGSLERLIPNDKVKLSPKMIEALDGAAGRL